MTRSIVAMAVMGMLVLQAGSVLAQDNCPGRFDLAQGITIEFSDGSHETFREPGMGIAIVDGTDPEGSEYRMELGHGIHLLAYANVVDGEVDLESRIVYDYGVELREMPVPTPGGRWSTPVFVLDPFGSRSEPQNHIWSETTAVTIGGCSYDMITAQISYKTGDGYVESVEYLPDLGIGYLVWNESETMMRSPVRPVTIRLASKK